MGALDTRVNHRVQCPRYPSRAAGASLNGPRDLDLGRDLDHAAFDGNVHFGGCTRRRTEFTIARGEPVSRREGNVADRPKLDLRSVREHLRLTYRVFHRFGPCLVGEL